MFLSLVNPDLPDTNPSTGKGGVLLRLYRDEQHLAPIFRYDRYAIYLPGTADPEVIPLEAPDYGGYFYNIPLPLRVGQILSASVLTPNQNPLTGIPGSIWHDEVRAVVFTHPGLGLNAGSTVNITARILRPTFTSGTTTIAVESGFTVSSIEAGGLSFVLTTGDPGLGQFSQSGTVVTLGVGEGYNLPATILATLTGVFSVTLPSAEGIALGFNLSNAGLDSLDGVDFLGLAYAPSLDVYAPTVGDYFWDGNLLTLFSAIGSAANLMKAPNTLLGVGSSGSVSYESWGGI